MKLYELFEASGYIPKNSKEASDPRWANAMTVDIKPGEDKRQAERWGFKLGSDGKPPKLKSNGKIDEAAMDVSVQGRMPQSPGSRGLLYSRADYQKVLKKSNNNVITGAVHALADLVATPGVNFEEAIIDICNKFYVTDHELSRAFHKEYNMSVSNYSKKAYHEYKTSPKKI